MLKFAQIREDMSLDVDHMKSLITDKTKLVAVVRNGHIEMDQPPACCCKQSRACNGVPCIRYVCATPPFAKT